MLSKLMWRASANCPGPVTDKDGNYSATVEYGWGGTVTPTREGAAFEPASRRYEKVSGSLDNQNYTSTLIQLTISGAAGIEDVVMSGLRGNPVTDANGRYTVAVDYGWSGTVTPTKEGYTFKPANRTYDRVTKNLTEQSYAGTLITFTISGTTGMEGVTMNGLPGNPVTGVGGLYSATIGYGWSGTVTPTKEGYTFDPPKRQYSDVTGGQFNQNYTAAPRTFTISGSTGMDGVVMSGLPGNPVTGTDGRYTATVNHNWRGTVTPTKKGYTFKPANRIYDPVARDQMNQDYTAALLTFTISGSTGMDGVVMNGLPGNPVSGVDGRYTATVDYGWSGTVTPAKEGYTFKPANRIYDPVVGNQMNQDYTGSLMTFTISGMVAAEGVVMNGLPGNPVTGVDGRYTATVNYGFSGTVTPTKQGYTFKPAARQYADVTGGQTNQDYTAAPMTFAISGMAAAEGVVMSGLPGNPVTDANGRYTATVNYGFSGTATPKKEGYVFKPAAQQYSNVTGGKTNQDYSATPIRPAISGAIIIGDTPIEGVLVSADHSGGSNITNAKGKYSITVPYGWSGAITPTKEGYIFDPPSKIYTNVTQDVNEEGEPRKAPERKAPVPEAAQEAKPGQLKTERKASEEKTAELPKKAEEPSKPAEEPAVSKLPEKPAVPEVPKAAVPEVPKPAVPEVPKSCSSRSSETCSSRSFESSRGSCGTKRRTRSF